MKVLLLGSGTAGHITPLLAVAKELYAQNPETQFLYVGQRGDPNIAVVANCDLPISIKTIYCGKFRRFHNLSLVRQIFNIGPNLKNARDIVLIGIGFLQALWIITTSKLNVGFFKGGSVVVPLGKACYIKRVPYITHDSDAVPGMANSLIAKHAAYNAVALEGAGKKYGQDKAVVVGIPVSDKYLALRGASKDSARERLGIDKDALVVFVFTGSQGARIIDDALESGMQGLLEEVPRLEIYQVFGRLNEARMHDRYASLSTTNAKRVHRLSFVDNAYDYIAASDLVVGRAGATSVAEVACIGRSLIIVPAEQLTGGHQLQNAQLLEQKDAAVIVREKDISELTTAIKDLLLKPEVRRSLEQNIAQTYITDSAARLADLLVKASRVSGDV